jgi:hypothetical protein
MSSNEAKAWRNIEYPTQQNVEERKYERKGIGILR